jgi:hypothetical protein
MFVKFELARTRTTQAGESIASNKLCFMLTVLRGHFLPSTPFPIYRSSSRSIALLLLLDVLLAVLVLVLEVVLLVLVVLLLSLLSV